MPHNVSVQVLACHNLSCNNKADQYQPKALFQRGEAKMAEGHVIVLVVVTSC